VAAPTGSDPPARGWSSDSTDIAEHNPLRVSGFWRFRTEGAEDRAAIEPFEVPCAILMHSRATLR